MRPAIAKVKNIQNLMTAYEALEGRDPGVPGMGLVYGFTGSGKTTAIAWFINQVHGIYLRAGACWTPAYLLERIIQEGRIKSSSPRSAEMVEQICESLKSAPRPLFIDEADYLLPSTKMIETLRDIHDWSEVPVILVGMEGIERKITNRKQLSRRISQWVEFQPADLGDTRVLSDTVCEVSVADDLVEKMNRNAKGSIGLMTVALSRIEAYARAQGWPEIDGAHWGDRPMFLSSLLNGGGPGNGGGKK